MLDARLKEISEKVDSLSLDEVSRNEVFLSTVLQATQIAIRTHQQDKYAALINAVTNYAIKTNIDENMQQMFLSFIDAFNEWHLRVLMFLDDPKRNLEMAGHQIDFYMGGVGQVLLTYYPVLGEDNDFTKQIVNDLHLRGLLNSDASVLNTMMTGSGMVASRTSPLGKKFLEFINLPLQLK